MRKKSILFTVGLLSAVLFASSVKAQNALQEAQATAMRKVLPAEAECEWGAVDSPNVPICNLCNSHNTRCVNLQGFDPRGFVARGLAAFVSSAPTDQEQQSVEKIYSGYLTALGFEAADTTACLRKAHSAERDSPPFSAGKAELSTTKYILYCESEMDTDPSTWHYDFRVEANRHF